MPESTEDNFWPAKQILPGVWIGSKRDAHSIDFMRRHGIGAVINCTRNIPFLAVANITKCRVPVDDHPDDNDIMARHLPHAVSVIEAARRRGRGVLVHCYAGISRSASVVCALVMRKFQVDPEVSMSVIRLIKPETFRPSVNFRPALEHFFRHYVIALALVFVAIVALLMMKETPAVDGYGDVETVFVSIASYRDDDCSSTLRELFAKAKRPDRIFVGVCQQNKAGEPAEECVDPTMPWRNNVRVMTLPHTKAKGPTFARYWCSRLYKNETYFCQLDAHTKFEQDWEQLAIEELHACPSPSKSAITMYPHAHENKSESSVPVLCKSTFGSNGIPSFEAVSMVPSDTPRPVPFIAGGFLFGPGTIVRDVPFDPTLDYVFVGEELLFAARLWTAGYDIYAPRRNMCTHFYGRAEKPKFWTDLTEYRDVQVKSEAKVKRVLGLDGHPPATDYAYGMGNERRLDEYYEYAGIDPRAQTSISAEKFCGVSSK